MKMQEVVMRLRELAPAAEQNVRTACEDFTSLRDMLKDAVRTKSPVSMCVLLATCSDKSDRVAEALDNALASIDALAAVNREYKERLGPRAKKPKDAEGQQMLPGFEDEGGTPTTMDGTPSFMQSGRHG